ncbi:eukaryotic-like serine/threonine-protein kinase [Frankia sp. AiPs1]|uniref:serine/threonine-protein kinase n=1 Tax=Frankia sp. AiPa1 TaxID=573492 RepID=UPI00202BA31D|nr:serine/threonine-protein kinase [Frankia sp. AiPa1]MCL9761641.1 serine/threonine-protein kinase [Frankia sp. AiPa1]
MTYPRDLPGRPIRAQDPDEIGPYRLRRILGEGGMGTVYFAVRDNDPPVAVKVIRAKYASAPGFRARFLREIHNAQQVQPFCTAAVLDYDDGPTPYLVTEYVDGPDLCRQITSGEPLSGNDVKRFAIGVANALSAIHNAGVVHRDLKPANVLLARFGPRVIDFGVAAALAGPDNARDTGDPDEWLTPAFMAPEQAQRARHHGRFDIAQPADVFAWGGVVLYAATGRAPFGEGTFAELFDKVVYEDPNLTGLPSDLEAIVRRALTKNQYRRPDARQLIASLLGDGSDPFEENSPDKDRSWETTIIAPPHERPPPETGPEVKKSIPVEPRRRRRTVVVLTGAAVAIVGLLAVLLPSSPTSPWHPSARLGACPTVTVYTGQHDTPYDAYGKALAARIEDRYPGTTVNVLSTNGTGDNLLRLQDPAGATCAMAVAQLNTTVDARFGVSQFDNAPLSGLRTVGPLWFDLLHVLVQADSQITDAAQLCTRTISAGLNISGTAQLGKVLFNNVLGCAPAQVPNDLTHGLADLRSGRIDGLVWAGGAPTPQIVQALGTGLRVRILPLTKYLQPMQANWDAFYRPRLGDRFVTGQVYEPVAVTSRDYSGVPAVDTIGVPNGLVVDRSADPDLVTFTARALVDDRAAFETALWGADSGRGFRTAREAISTSSLYCLIPLAPAAQRYYADIGVRPACAKP